MTRRTAAIATCLSALAAVAFLAPRPASAHDDLRRPGPILAVSLPPAPPPWVVAVLPPPPPQASWGGSSLSVYHGWLDANRAAYLARWGWNPWRVARYDAWYGGYRAALDARWAPPGRLAWSTDRGHDRKHGRGHERDRSHRDD